VIDLSVVVPLHNEAGNVVRLFGALSSSLDRTPVYAPTSWCWWTTAPPTTRLNSSSAPHGTHHHHSAASSSGQSGASLLASTR